MNNLKLKIAFFCIYSLCFAGSTFSQVEKIDGHTDVAMRMIGHEVLLSLGDSTSRVMPVEKIGKRYKIQFSSDFEFLPDSLVMTIGRVIEKTKLADQYRVQVENCSTEKIVYSYEIGILINGNEIPCKQRIYPSNCYNLFITLYENEATTSNVFGKDDLQNMDSASLGPKFSILIWAIIILVFSLIYFYLFKRKDKTPIDINPDIITIGIYQFNTKHRTLTYQDTIVELTQKETDLLLLLHNSANEILERDFILQKIWGDEGDYIGRTLDVFISKLRKKIDGDDRLKIVNVRGVGYKLLND